MTTDIAALGLQVDSDQVAEANLQLRAMPAAASAAERSIQKFEKATDAATASNDNFSKRVRRTMADLDFQSQQLKRSAAERERYAAVQRAGVTAESAAGQAIMGSVAALQAQRAAMKATADATKESTAGTAMLLARLGPLALAYVAVAAARKVFATGLKAGDLGEQAEQIGINTDQLQAWRLVAAQAGVETDQLDQMFIKLQKAMGSANEGNKEMIDKFERLGVKVLDAKGELRDAGDVMPELARGLLGVSSATERNTLQMDFLGKTGTKANTMLKDFAAGADEAVASAQGLNAIVSPAAIEKWDKFADAMKVVEVQWTALVGEFGADVSLLALRVLENALKDIRDGLQGIKDLWTWIQSNMDAQKRADVRATMTPTANDAQNIKDRLAAERQALAVNPNNKMAQASIKALEGQLAAREDAASRVATLANQTIFEMDESDARRDKLPGSRPALGTEGGGRPGVGSPKAKAGGGTDPFKSAAEGARDYVAAKRAEIAALGESAQQAALMKHEQALLNKATSEGKALTAQQTAELKTMAAAMAEVDVAFAGAKFMDDANKQSEQFIQQQQIMRETLFMSTEAAAAYRYEQEMLNKAANDNIVLTEEQKVRLGELAGAMAAQEEQTRSLRDMYEFGRETVRGFFSDVMNGLREGATIWDAFGNAAMNALNRIADKLIQMATDQLFEAAMGGGKSGGSGGGFLGGIVNAIGGLLGGGSSGAAGVQAGITPGGGIGGGIYAKGGAFENSNVVPFARGGIVTRPTMFRFAKGTGLMGEAGPEGILPLRRGRGGKLGVEASGVGGGDVFINVNNYSDAKVTAKKSRGPGGQTNIDFLVESLEQKLSSRVSRGQGSLGKTIEGSYGLQRVGK